jgi:hypothetical protein
MYVTQISSFTKQLPPLLLITSLFTAGAVWLIIITLFLPSITIDLNPATGVFGFLTSGDFLYVFFAVGLVGGALTFGAYGYILLYFTPLVLSTALFVEPFFS